MKNYKRKENSLKINSKVENKIYKNYGRKRKVERNRKKN